VEFNREYYETIMVSLLGSDEWIRMERSEARERSSELLVLSLNKQKGKYAPIRFYKRIVYTNIGQLDMYVGKILDDYEVFKNAYCILPQDSHPEKTHKIIFYGRMRDINERFRNKTRGLM